MKRFRPRLTYANVIASLALFIALGGAAVAAGLPNRSVGPRQLRNGAVTAKAIHRKAVTAGKIAPKAVTAGKLGANAVLPGNLGAGIISTTKIAAQAVTAEKIKNNVVTTNKLNNRAVTADKIAEKGVATTNLAESAVTNSKIANASITTAKLAPEVLSAATNVTTLKSGQTLRGVFSLGGTDSATAPADELITARGSFTFQQALAANPTTVTIVPKAGPFPTQCPGLGAGGTSPEATPGTVCIYVTNESNLEGLSSTALTEETNRLGVLLTAKAKKETKGEFVAAGLWAVTAP